MRLMVAATAVALVLPVVAGAQNVRWQKRAVVSQHALQIVDAIHGVRTKPPEHAPASNLPDGPAIGNGSVGVTLQEWDTSHILAYVGREGFWSVLRGRIMPMGRLELTIPTLKDAVYYSSENIGPADVTARYTTANGSNLHIRSWVANPQNLVVMELRNDGKQSMPISGSLLDAWGSLGASGTHGYERRATWLRVSPETVDAHIGERSGRDPAGNFHGTIRSVRIWAKAGAPQGSALRGLQPRYLFAPVSSTNTGSTREECGFLAMPQHAFTVEAAVKPSALSGSQAIFSAMTSDKWQHWPVPGPAHTSYGFSLSLVDGKLSAMLNRVRVTAPSTLSVTRWSDVAAAYNGARLSLYVNGHRVATTTSFPSTSMVEGPSWDWNAIHPGDRQLPFAGCAPLGMLAVSVEGHQARMNSGGFSLVLAPGQHANLVIAASDDRDGAHWWSHSINVVADMTPQELLHLWYGHLNWWRSFWSKSYISIPNKAVQANWYGSLYLLACSSRPGSIAPGLWGNFVTSPNPGWNGDYTLDYNYEAPFWAAYPTNHVSLADNYDAPLLYWMKRGEGLAAHRGYKGLFYYCHLSAAPGWSGDGAKAIRQKSDALFASVDCVMRWRYTHSAQYARRVYPFLRGVAQFWDSYLVLKSGRFMDYNDAADELHSPGDVNPATSIAFLKLLYGGLLDMDARLNLHETLAPKWRQILAHLSPLPVVPANTIPALVHAVGDTALAGMDVIRNTEKGSDWVGVGDRLQSNAPVRIDGSSAGMNSHQAVFPGLAVGLSSPPYLLKAAQNTIKFQQTWYDFNNNSSFYPAAAAVGYDPLAILKHMDLLIGHFSYPNFMFQMGGGGTENFATIPAAVCMMLLQSYQGSMRVFADWPKTEDASFGDLLACGDVEVSSALHGGRVSYVQLRSVRGGTVRVVNPWPGHRVLLNRLHGGRRFIAGGVLTVPTTKDEELMLTEAR